MSRSNTRERVGFVGLYRGVPAICSYPDLMMRVRPDRTRLDPDYLVYALMSPALRGVIQHAARGTSGSMVKINASLLADVMIPLPPLAEQKRIAAVLSSVDKVIESTEEVLVRLATVHRRAVEVLISGLQDVQQTEVGQISEVRYGLTVNKARRESPVTRPYLRVANVRRGSLDLSDLKFIGVAEGDTDSFQLLRDDLLCVEGHANPDEIGRCAIWQDEVPGCLHQNHILRMRPACAVVRPRYLLAYLNSSQGRDYFRLHAKTSSGLNTINSTVLARCPVALPSLDQQRRIEAAEAAVRTRVELEQSRLQRLRNLKQGLMHDLLSGRRRVGSDEMVPV